MKYLLLSVRTVGQKKRGHFAAMRNLSVCVLALLLELPVLAQDSHQPFTKSYLEITTEQAWNAAAKAAQELSAIEKHHVFNKTNPSNAKVEFTQFFRAFPTGRAVKFVVDVTRIADDQVQIAATPSGLAGMRLLNEKEVESLANQFFGLVDKEVEVLRSNARDATHSPFFSIRKSLIGVSAVARTALPVWLEPTGDTVFPIAFSKARTGDNLTITNILLCSRYPVGEVESECGTESVANRQVAVVLFNGAQPRRLPCPRPVHGSDTLASFGDLLDSFICGYGNAISCIQANQRTNVRELERLQSTMQHSGAEASWGVSELRKFEQTGPEIAFPLPSHDSLTQADLSSMISERLSRFVEVGRTDPSGLSAPKGKEGDASSEVAIRSVPDGAEIYLDGSFVGNAPSTLKVQSGEHSITVRKAGFQDWVRKVVFSGGSITLNAELVAGATEPVSVISKKQLEGRPIGTSLPASSGNSSRENVPGWIGVSTKKALGGGFLVSSVSDGGPASKAGLKIGDVIIDLNGVRVSDEGFESQIARYAPGSKISVGYNRSAWAFEVAIVVGKDPSY